MNQHDVKTMADGAAVVAGVSGFMQWFPPVVGLATGVLTLIWLSLRIWESDTVQKLVHGKKDDDEDKKV
jgi:hypothetical protein